MVRHGSPSPADNFPLGHSATSPQPQPSKRDKRRNMLAEKLVEMMASFSDNRDSHYRAQLAALTADINLIIKADAYANTQLEDRGEEASELVSQIMPNNVLTAPSAGTDYIAQCGKQYQRFVEAVNDAMEERDFNLTMLHNRIDNSKNEIENAHFYKVQIAEEEHKLLAATIRERLMASIQQRTGRLKREKEQLDLSDSNAMLLHPNQFGIGNPASPGGPQAPRKTRRTGHKFGDAEDLAAANENKRKRKLFEENDNDSPGPSGRNIEMGIGSPFREAKARTINAQFEASAYSLERLFTEKELNMAMNQATTAASNFFAKMRNADAGAQQGATNGHLPNGNGANGDHGSENGDVMDQDQDSDDIPGATDMARQVSSNPHATRGATRSAFNPSAAAIAAGQLPFISNPPYLLDAKIFQKANAAAPTPPALSAQDVEQDLQLMLRDAKPDDELNEKLLLAAVNPIRARDYQVQPPNFHEPVNEITSHVRSVVPHLEVGGGIGSGLSIGGVPMSAQSSMAGWSDTGANTPLGRFVERDLAAGGHGGGVPMTRTASGSGRGRGRGRGNAHVS
ncbi:Sds3-like-domain-containing protein [Phaeosphaeriaceae sp. PMI808]|nr:Sds3-like-domain-containing protein [Phaeosphaeriaceae sp. PMI808]